MKNSLIFFFVLHKIRFPAKTFHSLTIIFDIFKSGFNLSRRSPVLFNWAKTFLPYIQSKEWMKSLLDQMEEKDIKYITDILQKIEYIGYNNYVNYKNLYSKEHEDEKIKYLKYLNSQPDSNYFKKNGHGLVNEYSIYRDMKNYPQINGKDILDCGAFIGDSSIAFSNVYQKSHVFALEPHPNNFQELENVIGIHKKLEDITCLPYGVGDKNISGFLSDEGIGSKIGETGISINIRTIDSIVEELNLNPGLIKWDIEGFEYYSILGATETLKKYKPVLFISAYHNGRDLFEAKKYIQNLNLGYKFTFTRWDAMTPFSDTLLICY